MWTPRLTFLRLGQSAVMTRRYKLHVWPGALYHLYHITRDKLSAVYVSKSQQLYSGNHDLLSMLKVAGLCFGDTGDLDQVIVDTMSHLALWEMETMTLLYVSGNHD